MPPPDRAKPGDDDRQLVVVHNHYHADPAGAVLLAEIVTKLNSLLAVQAQQGAVLMSIADDLAAAKAALVTANETTNEIADDLDELIAKLASAPADSEAAAALKAEAESFTARLRGVADKYTKDVV